MITRSFRKQVRVSKRTLKKFSYIEPRSFIHEYNDDYYPSINKNEFDAFSKITKGEILKGKATLKGTEMFRFRNSKNLESHFNLNYQNTILHSSLSTGTYNLPIGKKEDLKLFNTILDSVFSGAVNTFDTGHHWRYQRSERVLGTALRYLATKNLLREELFLCTRIGHIDEDFDKGIERDTRISQLVNEMGIPEEEIYSGFYCYHPKFLRSQIEASLENLGVETLDLVYLNNPEVLLNEIDFNELKPILRTAFEFLEEMKQEGKIENYGITTWSALRKPSRDQFWMSLEEVANLANEVAGEANSFNYLTIPINLTMPEAFVEENQFLGGKPMIPLDVANAFKINVMSVSPFMSGYLSQTPLPSTELKSRQIHTKHLNLLRSLPYESIKSIVVGHSTNRHVKLNLSLAQIPKASIKDVENILFTPKRRLIEMEPQTGVTEE